MLDMKDRLARTRDFFGRGPADLPAASRWYRRELAIYYRHLIPKDHRVLEVGCGAGELLALLPNRDVTGVDLSASQLERAAARVPNGTFILAAGETLDLEGPFDTIILSDTINFCADAEVLLRNLRRCAGPNTRLILNFFNSVWRPIVGLGRRLGWASPSPPLNWLSAADIRNLLYLAQWEVVNQQSRILLPVGLGGLERPVNRFLAPLLPWFCLTVFTVARPAPRPAPARRSISVVVPARNEAGNIDALIDGMPTFPGPLEILFVEGHSRDDTWDRIRSALARRADLDIVAMRQTGKGKGNAVREAFAQAKGEILAILDADLSVAPSELLKFYDAIDSGLAEFANGVRMVYPMQDRAMRFLNMCANKFFGLAFSWMLGQPIKDTLCGSKALLKRHYEQIAANRSYFGDFDPFGDFDLLFGAHKLNLRHVDIPVHYMSRTYGAPNIDRWRDGALLFRMLLLAARKIKFL